MQADDNGGDRLLTGPALFGVVDGSTTQPWDPPGGPPGGEVADVTVAALERLADEDPLHAAVESLNNAVATYKRGRGIDPPAGACATFAAVHSTRREVWRVGDGGVVVDGRRWPVQDSGEAIVARARALVLRRRLADGERPMDLLRDDPGRKAIQPLLQELAGLRNRMVPGFGYPAIDGTPALDPCFLEVFKLPEELVEVIVASDGYPKVEGTLAESEAALAERLRRDPLMIEEPPATKGLTQGKNSFDDRAYIRLHVPPVEK